MSFAEIFTVVVPVFLLILVGYGTGRRALFDAGGAQALRELTMQLALPAALLLSIWQTPRHVLVEQLPLVGLLAFGFLAVYAVLLGVLRLAARRPLRRAALFALACVQPQYAFMGTSILGGLFGTAEAAVPIAVAGIIVNVVLDPVVLILLGLPGHPEPRTVTAGAAAPARQPVLATVGGSAPEAAAKPAPAEAGAPGPRPSVLHTVGHALREPFCWGPVLGLVLSVAGVGVPEVAGSALSLLAGAASATALLYVGVSVARIGRPALSPAVWAVSLTSVVLLPLLVYGTGLLLTSGAVAAQAALILAFPVSPVPLMFAARHGSAEDVRTVGSAVVLSLLLSFVTLPLLIELVG
ncbi:transport integral membrane protein [Streptomyces sp. NRRL B-1140]|uniref:AEC family transporter n=1 Tax=Streptomyces sp. NRRL B-1140 TaxID=1415549 RepID=UPI0006AF0961|nr:AEC family transporter [Streptomyces sp. NRRL B-1140]KOV99507.1 transport integral membrane protein [Streptomyces sp. NRRL B-1140]